MSTVDDIEEAVAKLGPRDLAAFRQWFEEFEAEHFDRAIERDVNAGKLDRLTERAVADHRKGRSREI